MSEKKLGPGPHYVREICVDLENESATGIVIFPSKASELKDRANARHAHVNMAFALLAGWNLVHAMADKLSIKLMFAQEESSKSLSFLKYDTEYRCTGRFHKMRRLSKNSSQVEYLFHIHDESSKVYFETQVVGKVYSSD